MGGAAFLRSVSVSSLLQGRATDHAPLVIIDSSANCQQAMESLAGSRILSAPLILRFGSKDAYQIIGWLAIGDLACKFAEAPAPPITDAMLSRMVALREQGVLFAASPVAGVHVRDDESFMQAEAEVHSWSLYELVHRLLRLPHQRPPLKPRQRIGMFSAQGHVSDILSISDVIRFLAGRSSELGILASRTIRDLGLLTRPLRIVPATMPADLALREMAIESPVGVVDGSGRLVAAFSQSDLRALRPSEFGLLALPLARYLVQHKHLSVPESDGDDSIELCTAALFEANAAVSLSPDDSLSTALLALAANRVHNAFVVDPATTALMIVSQAAVLDAIISDAD